MRKLNVYTVHPHTTKESIVVIDHDEEAMRIWLARHIYWCVRNDRSVHLGPATDDAEITQNLTGKRA